MLIFSSIESLVSLDQQCLIVINSWHAPWADTLMWYISKSTTWLPLYVVLLAWIGWHYGVLPYRATHKRTSVLPCLWIVIAFAVAVGGADYISSGLIKHWVCRPRPTHEPALEGMIHIVRGYTGGMYGFVSSHAANTMACALLFSLICRNKNATCGLMLWVVLNCYSRMYLGVHYPLDIIGGLVVGTLTALFAFGVLCWVGVLGRSNCSSSACARVESADAEAPATGGS